MGVKPKLNFRLVLGFVKGFISTFKLTMCTIACCNVISCSTDLIDWFNFWRRSVVEEETSLFLLSCGRSGSPMAQISGRHPKQYYTSGASASYLYSKAIFWRANLNQQYTTCLCSITCPLPEIKEQFFMQSVFHINQCSSQIYSSYKVFTCSITRVTNSQRLAASAVGFQLHVPHRPALRHHVNLLTQPGALDWLCYGSSIAMWTALVWNEWKQVNSVKLMSN